MKKIEFTGQDVQDLISELGIKNSIFASLINVSNSTVSKWTSEENLKVKIEAMHVDRIFRVKELLSNAKENSLDKGIQYVSAEDVYNLFMEKRHEIISSIKKADIKYSDIGSVGRVSIPASDVLDVIKKSSSEATRRFKSEMKLTSDNVECPWCKSPFDIDNEYLEDPEILYECGDCSKTFKLKDNQTQKFIQLKSKSKAVDKEW